MKSKLTLVIEKDIIEKAKEFATGKHQSLSEIVENYFAYLTSQSAELRKSTLVSPRVTKLRGVAKTDKDFDHKKVLEEEIQLKYGR
ncbi:MAG: DUF6364 family protein [Marinoscillum sp.]